MDCRMGCSDFAEGAPRPHLIDSVAFLASCTCGENGFYAKPEQPTSLTSHTPFDL